MKKLMNKKAFTLMEMLIVVAIIAVLVAIAIPTFTAQLEKAKEATDLANVRAAYAEIQVAHLVDGDAYPTSQADFDKIVGTKKSSATITYTPPKAAVAPATKGTDGTIVFKANKLTGGNGADTKTWTWTLDFDE